MYLNNFSVTYFVKRFFFIYRYLRTVSVMRSQSVFTGSGFVLPAPAPIKSRLSSSFN